MSRISRKQRYEQLVSRIRTMRLGIRKEVEAELAIETEKAKSEGKFLWENNWVTPEESRQIQRKLKIRDRIVFVELSILLLFMSFSSYALYFLMHRFLLPR